MTYSDIKHQALRTFRPAIALDAVFLPRTRRAVNSMLGALLLVSGLAALSVFASVRYPSLVEIDALLPFFAFILPFAEQIYGIFLITLSFRIVIGMFNVFHASYYFKDLAPFLFEYGGADRAKISISYEAATVLAETPDDDVTKGFAMSYYGALVFARCGVSQNEVAAFLSGSREKLSMSISVSGDLDEVTLETYARAVYQSDKDLQQFLFSKELQENDFVRAAEWIGRTYVTRRKKERFWSRDNLGRIPGIGKTWAYGQIYILKRYGHDIKDSPLYSAVNTRAISGVEEVEALEVILSRAEEANAVLVGEDGAGKMEILARFARKIYEGTVFAPIEHKQVIVFDGSSFLVGKKEKSAFEEELLRIFNQVVRAGNIILVLKNFPAFIRSASSIGSDVVNLLDPYFASKGLQIIATANFDQYHQDIERNSQLMRRFQPVLMQTSDETTVVRLLENAVLSYESSEKVFFTYPAVLAIARSADQYITVGVMPDKALDLMVEVISAVKRKGNRVIGRIDVMDYVSEKTGIPTGTVGEAEKQRLLNLEALIHERIVGQDEAVSAIANAMRRARAGVRAMDRPMGSFLFLGPTGVGKTETAKTLAKIFFGSENDMMRLDMSEYQTDDALERLIGHYAEGKPGVFTSMLREKSYGVLLLDEFEKTNKDVHDLFLQILDEGVFSDMAGKRVNARNLIIIATSNAGSDMIWQLFQKNEDVMQYKDELIDTIIKRGIYAPELLNRFDGVIVFHPLEKEHIRAIANILLSELAERLREQGIELSINEALVNLLVHEGYSPEFGARPMSRAIQEKVEQVIALRKLNGDIKAGDTVELSENDFA